MMQGDPPAEMSWFEQLHLVEGRNLRWVGGGGGGGVHVPTFRVQPIQ